MAEAATEILRRFVLRGRRIGAHSLAADRPALEELATLKFTGVMHLDGTVQMTRILPDEEVFESLAARVRPLLLPSESIHFPKVLAAIRTIVSDNTDIPTSDIEQTLDGLENEWSFFEPNTTRVVRFAVQSAAIDGSSITPQVSDTQLANAWLYGDLVHVDARGPKADGLLFPIKDRYAAAVTYFAHAALASLRTLDLLLELDARGIASMDEAALNDRVVAGKEDLIETSVVHIAPVSATMPELSLDLGPQGWRPFTVTELLRQNPQNQIRVSLEDAEGTSMIAYEAAVTERSETDGRLHWKALIAGSVALAISVGRNEDGQPTGIRFEGLEFLATTNQMKLAEAEFMRAWSNCKRLLVLVKEVPFFALSGKQFEPEERTSLDILVDTLEDLVGIEQATVSQLEALSGTYTDHDRVYLRRTRLLWQGRIIPFHRGPFTVTSEAGKTPQVIMIPASSTIFGDLTVPTPQIAVRHPSMVVESVRRLPGDGPQVDEVTLKAPDGSPFVAWAPERVSVSGDPDLANPTAWGLSHLDANSYLGAPEPPAA